MIDSDLKLVLAVILTVVGLLCATVVTCVAIGAYTDYQCIKAGCPRATCGQVIAIHKEPSCGLGSADNKEDK